MKNLILLCNSQCELGEGPLWVPEEQSVYWVDIIGKSLHRIKLDGSNHQTWHFDSEITSINRRVGGGFIATFTEGFAFVDLPSGKVTAIDSPEQIPTNRFNDGKTDSHGNLWAGTMDNDEKLNSGVLYKLSPSLHWQVMDEDYCITNGPAFSKDEQYVYHTDTLARVIYQIEFSRSGKIKSKEVLINIPEQDGFPDGMTVDSNGDIWVCHFAGGKVSKFSAAGCRIADYPMPVTNITSCTFVGDDHKQIVFTTARKGLSKAQLAKEPSAGGLYIAEVNRQGVSVSPFAG